MACLTTVCEEEFEKVKSKRQRKRDNRKKNIKVKKGDIEGNKGVTKENENIVKDMYELNEELDNNVYLCRQRPQLRPPVPSEATSTSSCAVGGHKKIEYYQKQEDMNKELKILQAIEPEGFNPPSAVLV